MPLLIYIGAVMSILYYMGLTQVLAQKVGWFMQVTMGTTAIESLGVAANIFLNGVSSCCTYVAVVVVYDELYDIYYLRESIFSYLI